MTVGSSGPDPLSDHPLGGRLNQLKPLIQFFVSREI